VPFDIPHPVTLKRFLVYDPNSAKQARLKLFIEWLEAEMALGGVGETPTHRYKKLQNLSG
jgi:hypothetical protein